MPDWGWVKADVALINPASGPGTQKDHDWDRVIFNLRAKGVAPIPYVALGYGSKSISDVKDELNRYRQWYGLKGGAFYDEAPVKPIKYIMDINGFARKNPTTGKKTGSVFFNPGARPAGLLAAMTATPNAVWVTFEGSEEAYHASRLTVGPYKSREAHIVYAAENYVITKMAMQNYGVGWGFLTNDVLPNPFDIWPTVVYNLD